MDKKTIEGWKLQLTSARKFRKNYGKAASWDLYRDFYRGVHPGWNGQLSTEEDILPFHLIYGIGKTVVPNVYFRNPYTMVSPRSGRDYFAAKVKEAAANWLMQEMDLKAAFKTAVLDAFICGRGILKVGYGSKFAFSGSPGIRDLEIEESADSFIHPHNYDNTVSVGMPFVHRVEPYDFLVAFGTRRLSNCAWCSQSIVRRLEDAKSDKRFKGMGNAEATHLYQLSENDVRQNSQYWQDFQASDEWVQWEEVRDLARKEVFCLMETADKVIFGPVEDALQIDGSPFSSFCFNEDSQYFWAPSDCNYLEAAQLEINDARTQAMRHRRVALARMIATRGLFREEELDKLISEKVLPVVLAEGQLNDKLQILQPHIPQELMPWVREIMKDAQETVGIGRQAKGEFAGGRKTKGEVEIVEMNKEIRMDEKRDAVADCLAHVMRKVLQLVGKFWTEEKVVQVVGIDGAKYWVRYSPEDLRGEFDLKVDVESMTPTTKMRRKKELMELVQALGSNPAMAGGVQYLMKLLLREFSWLDTMAMFPEAAETQGTQVGVDEFSRGQEALRQNPQALQARMSGNMQALGGVMNVA